MLTLCRTGKTTAHPPRTATRLSDNHFEAAQAGVFMKSRTISDVALRSPVSVSPHLPIRDAEQLLIARLASELYVIDEQEMLLGVVPDGEILKYRLIGGDGGARIAALMSPVTIALEPDASLAEGARLLREHVHASLPVLENGRLIGQLCRLNLLRLLAELGPIDSMGVPTTDHHLAASPHYLSSVAISSNRTAIARKAS
jgi:CBS domain-containing protein